MEKSNNKKVKNLCNELSEWHSKLVRKKEGSCITCGSSVEFNSAGDPISHQASHFQRRAQRNPSAYMDENVHCQCNKCHMYHHNQSETPYHLWMQEHYGIEEIERLLKIKKSPMKMTIYEMEERLEEIKKEYAKLKEDL